MHFFTLHAHNLWARTYGLCSVSFNRFCTMLSCPYKKLVSYPVFRHPSTTGSFSQLYIAVVSRFFGANTA